MDQKLLHTPEGVRDIYKEECERKLTLQNHLHEIMKRYGYRDIETPTFEFFDVFSKEVEPRLPGICINFLTEKEILWFSDPILLLPSHGQRQNIWGKRPIRCVSAIWEILLLIIPAIRDI